MKLHDFMNEWMTDYINGLEIFLIIGKRKFNRGGSGGQSWRKQVGGGRGRAGAITKGRALRGTAH